MQEKTEMKPEIAATPATGKTTIEEASEVSLPAAQEQFTPRFRIPTDPKFTKKYKPYDKVKAKAAKAARKMTRMRRK